MSIKVRCPSCEKILSVQDSYHHKKIKCPDCHTKFKALTVEEAQREERIRKRLAGEQRKVRTQLAQQQEAEQERLNRTPLPPSPGTIFTLGLLGICIPVTVVLPALAWYFSNVYQDNVKHGRMEPNAMVNAANLLGKIGTIIGSIFWLYYLPRL